MAKIIMLDKTSPEIQYLCNKDKPLAKVIDMIGPLTYQVHDEEPYGFLIHEIIEQMLSVKAGAKIYQRLQELCGGNITPSAIAALSDEQIKSTGTSNAKVAYIRGITMAVTSGQLNLKQLEKLDDCQVVKQLTAFRGIGNWTAKIYLIFVLNRLDILPYEDVAFLQAYSWVYKTSDFPRQLFLPNARSGSRILL